MNIKELYAIEVAYGHPVARTETDKCVKLDEGMLHINTLPSGG
jgi:hypothetical protein